MNINVTNQWVHQLRSQRNVFVGILAISLLLNVLQGVERLTISQKTIILPPDIKQGVWVSKNTVSESYLEEWAVYLGTLLLSKSPGTVDYYRDLLLRHISPESTTALKNKIELEDEHVQKNQAAMTFLPKEIIVNAKDLTVVLEGTQATYLGKERVSDVPVKIRLSFRLETGGRLYLVDFNRIEKENTNDHEPLV